MLQRLAQVVALFLKLGSTAFGGPAAHIGILHDEVVDKRKWLDDERFLDLIGATNLLPGPNSTEMAMHIGFLRAGWLGLILGGVSFILPAMLIVIALAWAYKQFGSVAQATWLLYGVKPVVIAIIAQALWLLGRKAFKNWRLALVGAVVFSLYFGGVNEIALLFGGGMAVLIGENIQRVKSAKPSDMCLPWLGFGVPAVTAIPFDLSILFVTLLKIGAVLYGGGYVLLAFLRADFVVRLGWLTDQELVDAIAIGQITPGPLSTTATFIGYLLGDVPGAVLATVGIFLPAFVFVAISNPLIPRLRGSPWAASLLDGVNAASLALMAAVTVVLSQAALVDPMAWLIAILAAILLVRFKANSTLLVIAGAAAGFILAFV